MDSLALLLRVRDLHRPPCFAQGPDVAYTDEVDESVHWFPLFKQRVPRPGLPLTGGPGVLRRGGSGLPSGRPGGVEELGAAEPIAHGPRPCEKDIKFAMTS